MSEFKALGNGYIVKDGDYFPAFIDAFEGNDGNIEVVIYQETSEDPKAVMSMSLKSAIMLGRSLSQVIQEHLAELKAMNEGISHE